jgi:peptidoglycan/LPS O-acetylase OafA/YrhL
VTTVATPGASRAGFRSDIQGLRAVAVLLVIADHLLGDPVGGFIGVDVFFVISGFLITGLLLREGERRGRISLREFYARRVRRILPVALLVLAATVVASHLVLLPSRAAAAWHDALWAGGFLANVHMAQVGTDYFAQGLPPSPLQHYWSLSVEEQFYVVWPLLLLVLFALGRRLGWLTRRATLAVLAAAITLGSLLWSVHLTATAPTDAYFSTATRAWELSLGALVALSARTLVRLPTWLRASAGWAGLAGIAAGAALISESTPFPGSAALLPVVATGVVLAAGNPRGGPGASLALGNPVVQYVGNISYSLYLWHFPCIVLATAYFGVGGVPFYVAAGVLPALLSVLSFHLLEEPVRRSRWLSAKPVGYQGLSFKQWYRENKRGLDIALVGSAATAVFLAGWVDLSGGTSPTPALAAGKPVTVSQAGDAAALSPQQLLLVDALRQTRWGRINPSLDSLSRHPDGCTTVDARNVSACVYGDPNGSRTAVVIGDSIAMAWTPGVVAALQGSGWRVQMLTMSECPAPDLPTYRNRQTRGTPYRACQEHRAWALAQVQRLHPDLALISSLTDFANRIVGVADSDRYTAWRDGTAATIRALQRDAGHVVVLGAPPSSGNLQTCVTARSTPADCVRPVTAHETKVAAAERAAARLTGARFVVPLGWFCYGGLCPAVVDGVPVMRDGTHTTAAWMRRIAPLLRPILLAAA